MEETALLKVSLSINQREDCFNALIEADLGAEYRRAS